MNYDFQAEANRIIEALQLTGAQMTLVCALREAYSAGSEHADREEILAALRAIVLSAHPKKSEQPSMFEAWQLAHAVIARATGVNSALGVPDHICVICYHPFDLCSHCYDSGSEVCEVCGTPQQNGVFVCDGCNKGRS